MNQLPDYLQNRPSRGLAERVSQNLGTSSPPYLSIRDNKFTLVDAAGNELPVTTYEPDPNKCMRGQAPGAYIDVLIADVNDHTSQIFYDEGFDPHATSWKPPACFSHNGKAPSTLASKPQAKSCVPDPTGEYGCRWSVWGSATSNVTGKEIPACGKYQFIAVIPIGMQMAFLLRIPPNSLDNYKKYAEQFRGQKFTMEGVITRLSFVSQGTLAFIPSGFPIPEMLVLSDNLYAAKAMDAMVGRLDVPIPTMLPAPQAQPQTQLSGFTSPQVTPQQPFAAQPVASQPTPMAPPQTMTAPAAMPAASPSSPAPAQGGRRRRNTAAAAPQVPPTQPQQMQAPFMDPASPSGFAATGPVPQVQPNGPAQTFGMAPGIPPNAEVTNMLDNLFGTPQ